MTHESIHTNYGELSDTLHHSAKVLRESATAGGTILKEKSSEMLDCASERIRNNPLPAVAGAFVLGIAVGCLIVSSRHDSFTDEPFIAEPLDLASHIGESITTSLSRLYSNLKFW